MALSARFFFTRHAALRHGGQGVPFTPPALAKIDAFQKQSQFPRRDLLSSRICKRELKRSGFESLVPDGPAIPVPVQNLESVGAPVTVNQQMS